MSSKPKIAISVGDLNGVGMEIALKAHKEVSELCTPVYCINKYMLAQAAQLLHAEVPEDIEISFVDGDFDIKAGEISAPSGRYSFDSFMHGVTLCEKGKADAIVTMPINKEAWMESGLKFKGHTDALRQYFKRDAIMMLGCEKMYVALYTEHMPLKDVAETIKEKELTMFMLHLNRSLPDQKIAVLGLNPHAGDNGVLGDEENIINKAIDNANKIIEQELFVGPLVPDVAFTPGVREDYKYYLAMYHDQGLAPLKALYFDESINISLNLPIVRTSVDHGTAFDIAYKGEAKTLSYLNAVKSAIEFINRV